MTSGVQNPNEQAPVTTPARPRTTRTTPEWVESVYEYLGGWGTVWFEFKAGEVVFASIGNPGDYHPDAVYWEDGITDPDREWDDWSVTLFEPANTLSREMIVSRIEDAVGMWRSQLDIEPSGTLTFNVTTAHARGTTDDDDLIGWALCVRESFHDANEDLPVEPDPDEERIMAREIRDPRFP